MIVEKVNARDVFEDDNNGLIYGLQECSDFPAYVEWFKTEQERNRCISKNKMTSSDGLKSAVSNHSLAQARGER